MARFARLSFDFKILLGIIHDSNHGNFGQNIEILQITWFYHNSTPYWGSYYITNKMSVIGSSTLLPLSASLWCVRHTRTVRIWKISSVRIGKWSWRLYSWCLHRVYGLSSRYAWCWSCSSVYCLKPVRRTPKGERTYLKRINYSIDLIFL